MADRLSPADRRARFAVAGAPDDELQEPAEFASQPWVASRSVADRAASGSAGRCRWIDGSAR